MTVASGRVTRIAVPSSAAGPVPANVTGPLAGLDWLKPVAVQLFGGRFDPALLQFPLNKMAGAAPASDIRDWDAIREWTEGLVPLMAHRV